MTERKRVLSLTVSVGGGMKATVRFAGAELQPEDIAKLTEYLNVIQKALMLPSGTASTPGSEPNG